MSVTGNTPNFELETWPFKSPTTIMIPYRADATEFWPEDYIVSIYYRLVTEDLLTTIFPGMGFDHLNKFVNYMSRKSWLVCLTRNERDITDTAGFGYITETNGVDGARNAGFGFGFFKAWHATPEARFLSWFMLDFWLERLNIDVLFGTTLKANGLARNFSLNFGFKGHTEIPKFFFRNGQLEDATIMLLEKQDFLPKYEAWRETWNVVEAPVIQ
jgi:hypothetical protein